MRKHAGAFVTGVLGVVLAYSIGAAYNQYRLWAQVRDFVYPIMMRQAQQTAAQQAPQPSTPAASPSPEVRK